MTTTTLPLGAAVQLAHALVAQVARDRGIRVIFLKGPIATAQGLREPDYLSTDVDAYCEPDRVTGLVDALTSRGWSVRPESEAHAKFVTHSITLIHPQWPCDIDVHTSYPGFLAPPAQVFDALWRRREPHDLAQVTCFGPEPSAQALVLLLHGLRAPHLSKNAIEIDQARERFAAMAPEELDDVVTLVGQTGCAEVVHDLFADVGREIPMPATPTAEYLQWRLISRPSRTEGWVAAISAAHGRERLVLLYRAVLPSREHLAIDHPEATVSRVAAARAYRARLIRAAALMPAAVRNVLAARRAKARLPVAAQPMDRSQPAADDAGSPPAARSADRTPATDRVPLAGPLPHDVPARIAVYTSPDQAGPHHEKAFVLPLAESGPQVPFEVNATGLDVLTLLVDSGGDVEAAVAEAAALWEKPVDELRPVIAEFRSEMVKVGALVG